MAPRRFSGLLAEGSGRPDVRLELLERNGEIVLGRSVLEEEPGRDAVDRDVRGLSGEHDGNQELEVVEEAEGDHRVGVLGERGAR